MRRTVRPLFALALLLVVGREALATDTGAPAGRVLPEPQSQQQNSAGTRPRRLFITRLNVRDLAAALRFFGEGLGLTEQSRFSPSKGTTEVSLGDPSDPLPGSLMLVHRESHLTPYDPGEWGAIILEVRDVKAVAANVVRAGGTLVRPPRDVASAPVTVAFVKDPDGHEIELVQRK